MTEKTLPPSATYGEAVYESARFVGVPAEAIDRFLGAVQACGWHLTPVAEIAPQPSEELKVAERICGLYFGIAEEVVGAEEVRRRFKLRFDRELSVPSETPQKPIAWRWRIVSTDEIPWLYATEKPNNLNDELFWDVEPLFAASAHSATPLMTEARAREILGTDIKSDGNGLYCLGRYLSWNPDEITACLDADFDADELEAIAWWMRNKVKP